MLVYLSVEEVAQRLTAMRPLYEATGFEHLSIVDTLLRPESGVALGMILDGLEERVDQWVGYRIAPTQYTEQVGADALSPLVVMSNYPIISIDAIAPIPNRLPYYLPNVDTCKIGGIRTINLLNPMTAATITYTAGYSPIPPVVKDCIFQALIYLISSGNPANVGILTDAARDVQTFQLPSGLLKTWKVSAGDKAQSILDRLFAPLETYKRVYQTGASTVV